MQADEKAAAENLRNRKMGQFFNPDKLKPGEWKARRAAEAEGLRQHKELLGAMEVQLLTLDPKNACPEIPVKQDLRSAHDSTSAKELSNQGSSG